MSSGDPHMVSVFDYIELSKNYLYRLDGLIKENSELKDKLHKYEIKFARLDVLKQYAERMGWV